MIAKRRRPGITSRNTSSRLPAASVCCNDRPVALPPGRARELDHADADRVTHRREHDRDDRRRLLCCNGGRRCGRDNDIHLQPNELGRGLGEPLVASLRPPILDGDGASLVPTEFAKSLHKSVEALAIERTRAWAQISNGRQLGRLLLGAAGGKATAAPPSSVMNSRRRMSNMGFLAAPCIPRARRTRVTSGRNVYPQ